MISTGNCASIPPSRPISNRFKAGAAGVNLHLAGGTEASPTFKNVQFGQLGYVRISPPNRFFVFSKMIETSNRTGFRKVGRIYAGGCMCLQIFWIATWNAPSVSGGASIERLPLNVLFCEDFPQFTTILPSCQAMKTTAKSEKKHQTARSKNHPKKWEIMGHPFEKKNSKLHQAPLRLPTPAVGAGDPLFVLHTPPTVQAVLAGQWTAKTLWQKLSVVGGKIIYFIERDWTEDVKSCQVKLHQRVLVV